MDNPIILVDWETGQPFLNSQIPFITQNLPRKVEKRFINPVQYRINYQIAPIFAILQIVLILAAWILLETDDVKYLVPGISLIVAMFALDAGLVVWVCRQKLGRWAKKDAACRYNLDSSKVPEQDQYEIPYESTSFTLTEPGLHIGGKFYYYGPLEPRLVTSHKFNQVWIAVQFGTIPVGSLFVPPSPELMKAIDHLGIPIQNKQMLDYLRDHKENAIAQIYNTGTFYIVSDET